MSAQVIAGNELARIARARYPGAYIRCLDADYNIPTDESFGVFCKELARELFEKYGDKWREYFDCDNFTFDALALAYRKHFVARWNNVGSAQGVALGLLCFRVKPDDWQTGHCIVTRLTPSRQLEEFEPQNRQTYPLTSLQCASADLCLFF